MQIKAPLEISQTSAPILVESVGIKKKTYIINYKQKVRINLDLMDLELQLKNNPLHE